MDPLEDLLKDLPYDTCQACHKVMPVANMEGLCPTCNPSSLKVGSYVRLKSQPLCTIGVVEDIVGGNPVVHFENGLEPVTLDHAPATDYEVVSEFDYAAELQIHAAEAEYTAQRNEEARKTWGFMFQEV